MFRFTIREMLLFTVIVGLALGWWLDHRRFVIERVKFNPAYANWLEDELWARHLAVHRFRDGLAVSSVGGSLHRVKPRTFPVEYYPHPESIDPADPD